MQWNIHIDGNTRGSYHSGRTQTDSFESGSEYISYTNSTLSKVCHLVGTSADSGREMASLLIFADTKKDSLNSDCSDQDFEKVYYSVTTKENAEELCKDQFSLIYINTSVDYVELITFCHKMKATIPTVDDAKTYRSEIEKIHGNCRTDDTLISWIKTDSKSDFKSLCPVLLVNGSLELRPCHRSLDCALCKVHSSLQVTVFGNIHEFDRNYTARITGTGDLFLKGHENSIIKKIEESWVMQSAYVSLNCTCDQSALPFVRMTWICGQGSKILTLSTCTLEEFVCDDGTCQPEFRRCDGVMNCEDGSDENKCILVRKKSGYDVKRAPPPFDGGSLLSMMYTLDVFSVADVKMSNFYIEVDLSISFEWQDRRLELFNPSKLTESFDCTEIWILQFKTTGGRSSGGQMIPPSENHAKRCNLKVRNWDHINKEHDDPYMGKCGCSIQNFNIWTRND